MREGELLDTIRLALFECKIDHDDVEQIAEHIRRRICERFKQEQSEFWNDFDPDEVMKFVRELRDMDKVGGTIDGHI